MEVNELILFINSIKINKSKKIEELDALAINVDGFKGVAVEVEKDIVIYERFNNVILKNETVVIKGQDHNIIILGTKDKYLNEKYGLLCYDFLDLAKRELIKDNPILWFNEWKELLGTTNSKKMIYDVVGEMKVLLELQKRGENPFWNSTEVGTFDITSEKNVYEVKTSKSKTVETVVIHNQFQLDEEVLSKPLMIAFCKLEENVAGESIDSLASQLIENGYDKDNLENYLNSKGYYIGKQERYKCFIINEIRLYEVNSSFPRITKDSFVEGKIPKGIVNYQYTVSLDGLEYIRLI